MHNPFEGSEGPVSASDPFAAPATGPAEHPLVFSGRGSEYFGIWIVNLLLTVATLGIYSAWAKVRRLQYFHRHTTLGGASFDYHGDPRAILKGRVIAVILLLAYNLSFEYSPVLGVVVVIALAIIMPALLMRSLRFRARNTSWRGLRFGFDGDLKGAYTVFLAWPVLSVISLYLLAPMWHQRMKRYQLANARFGATPFTFSAPVSAFYKMYALMLVLVVTGGIVAGLLVAVVIGALTGANRTGAGVWFFVGALGMWVGMFVLVQPYLLARLQNIVWNNVRLGPHRFESRARARTLFAIMLTNIVAIVCTFGLFMPFAAIRLARYRIESVTMISTAPLDAFIAGQSADVAATGQEAADLFDVDIAL